ncbi:NAD(P)H-dependent oxidoreductase [Thiomicrospira microaerophila]|uniref:NADPH-dependent FMN reductase n=1 Tax=Thiomicrospira microaerophila TaxID=406020 RepID=UPI0020105DB0|nr:NAD(P)H-dependent oxidoreductase [Thiomicrospira microaerophila]UQB42201.1 NAD(P)H-dependent oxidoreductase [Thiomicrospira microaerophila]
MNFLGLSGSLRKASLNTALLRETTGLLPEGVAMTVRTLEDLPLLNPDQLESGFPDAVNVLAAAVKQADALVLASPEFNYSVTAVMKNAMDWLSIHPDAPLKAKPVALMSASPSAFGGGRAQYHLREILIYPGARLLGVPEIMVTNAFNAFNEQGALTNQTTRDLIIQQMQALKVMIQA